MKALETAHRARLADLLAATPEFTADEARVALEVIDDALAGDPEYRELVDEAGDEIRGYICFGPTPVTRGTWDLYWICVSRSARKHGVGRALVAEMERRIAAERGRLVRVETEGSAAYEPTRAFYEAIRYERLATIRDFYDVGNDLVLFGKYL